MHNSVSRDLIEETMAIDPMKLRAWGFLENRSIFGWLSWQSLHRQKKIKTHVDAENKIL